MTTAKNNKKMCPFTFINPEISDLYCEEEKCAWWNPIDEECSILTLATLATIDIGGRDRR